MSYDIAKELGFEYIVEKKDRPLVAKNGYQSAEGIRWSRINKYLSEYGFPPTGRGQYITKEND